MRMGIPILAGTFIALLTTSAGAEDSILDFGDVDREDVVVVAVVPAMGHSNVSEKFLEILDARMIEMLLDGGYCPVMVEDEETVDGADHVVSVYTERADGDVALIVTVQDIESGTINEYTGIKGWGEVWQATEKHVRASLPQPRAVGYWRAAKPLMLTGAFAGILGTVFGALALASWADLHYHDEAELECYDFFDCIGAGISSLGETIRHIQFIWTLAGIAGTQLLGSAVMMGLASSYFRKSRKIEKALVDSWVPEVSLSQGGAAGEKSVGLTWRFYVVL